MIENIRNDSNCQFVTRRLLFLLLVYLLEEKMRKSAVNST